MRAEKLTINQRTIFQTM